MTTKQEVGFLRTVILKPFIVYLDQMHWVDLAKAYHKRDKGKYLPLLKQIQLAIQEKRIIFPLSIFHVLEALKNQNVPRRERFAQAIVEISQGWIIAPPWQVVPQELEIAVMGLLDKQPHILKEYPSLDKVEALFTIYEASENQATIKKYKTVVGNYACKIEAARQQNGKAFTREALRYLYARNLIVSLAPDLTNLSAKYRKSPEELIDILGMFENVPTLNVQLELATARDRNLNKPVDPNDIEDISFLSVAIPYCDIVITENSWADYATRKQLQLNKKYNTIILSNLLELENYLRL